MICMQNPKNQSIFKKKKKILFGFTYSYSIYGEFEILMSDLSLCGRKIKRKKTQY